MTTREVEPRCWAAVPADVTRPDDAERLIAAAAAAFSGVDILINNVGGGGGSARIEGSSDDEWRTVLDTNLVQTVRMMRLALARICAATQCRDRSTSGVDVRLGATARDVRSMQVPRRSALIFATERWALEFVPHGIRVNTVSPGSILVPGQRAGTRYRHRRPGALRRLRMARFPHGANWARRKRSPRT